MTNYNEFMRTIVEDDIKEFASKNALDRGQRYFKENRVELVAEQGDHLHLHVRGSHGSQYCVDIARLDEDIYYECNCPANASFDICKHIVASLLFIEKQVFAHKDPTRWQKQLNEVVQMATYYSRTGKTRSRQTVLFLSLQQDYYGYGYQLNGYRLDRKLFPDDLFKDDDIDNFALATYLVNHPEIAEKPKAIDGMYGLNSGNDVNISPFYKTILALSLESNNFYRSQSLPTKLDALRQFEMPLFTGSSQRPFENLLHISPHLAQIHLDLSEHGDQLTLSLKANVGDQTVDLHTKPLEIFGTDPYWLKTDSLLAKCEEQYPHFLVQKLIERGKLAIPKAQKSFFVTHYLAPLLEHLPLGGTAVSHQKLNTELEGKQLFLEEKEGDLAVTLHFRYGPISLPHAPTYPQLTTTLDEINSNAGQLTLIDVQRDPEMEEAIYRSTSSAQYGLKYAYKTSDETFVLRSNTTPLDFLLKKLPILTADGYEIFGEDNLKSVRVNRHKPTISFNVSSGIDWFDIEALVQFGDVPVDLKTVRQSLRRKERFIKLADGTIGEIPEEWLEKYRHLFYLGEQNDDNIRFSNHHLTLLDQLLAQADQTQVDVQYRERLQKLRSFEGIAERPLPDGFVGELRPYQKAGLNWLHFLHDFNFGGCLADDMGLGKTVQVLTLLQSLHEQDNSLPPNLIVLPRSLLVNWEREAQRFTPNLKIFTHFGTDRPQTTEPFADAELILTTYGVVRRDIKMLRQFTFHYIILDESQAIKNPNTKIAKSVRLLKSQHRLVMTGTPVENSTFELWSQFAFLNPGLLGGVDYFRKEFSNPIERNNDKTAAELLRKMVYPFILRRTKDQVALDLPPRTDRVMYVEMDKAQRNFYTKTRDNYRAQLLGLIESQGINSARFKVLEGLLRLRQICNHPRLVRQNFRGDSAKMTLLVETLQTLHEEGHKALIFSQFVKMLQLIRDEIEKLGLTYTYLDGHTRKRQERVDKFQNDPNISFFLISLKAGGVGLNLTAADYVIHVDPWWNPAVEMQASDRSHRIGQENPVFVYKLITKDSVEEKILELQQRKQNLVEQLITAESNFLKQLTAEDVQVLFS
ncbi:MAG: serine/threonine protein kinase [Anaerolineaceae bacterium]|nr:serine/threonine protein kinase [Anaerolineaceae bacterium]